MSKNPAMSLEEAYRKFVADHENRTVGGTAYIFGEGFMSRDEEVRHLKNSAQNRNYAELYSVDQIETAWREVYGKSYPQYLKPLLERLRFREGSRT